jgi:hypothetical protein
LETSTKDGYEDWLKEYKWSWACTLKFRTGIRRKSAHRLWREWIERLEEIEEHSLSWARMFEIGKEYGKLHVHGAIAGVHRATATAAESHWWCMAGDAQVRKYYSDGWLEYLLKEMESNDDYDFDFELLPQHRRPEKLSETPFGDLK